MGPNALPERGVTNKMVGAGRFVLADPLTPRSVRLGRLSPWATISQPADSRGGDPNGDSTASSRPRLGSEPIPSYFRVISAHATGVPFSSQHDAGTRGTQRARILKRMPTPPLKSVLAPRTDFSQAILRGRTG
jgi:hypothetical protein